VDPSGPQRSEIGTPAPPAAEPAGISEAVGDATAAEDVVEVKKTAPVAPVAVEGLGAAYELGIGLQVMQTLGPEYARMGRIQTTNPEDAAALRVKGVLNLLVMLRSVASVAPSEAREALTDAVRTLGHLDAVTKFPEAVQAFSDAGGAATKVLASLTVEQPSPQALARERAVIPAMHAMLLRFEGELQSTEAELTDIDGYLALGQKIAEDALAGVERIRETLAGGANAEELDAISESLRASQEQMRAARPEPEDAVSARLRVFLQGEIMKLTQLPTQTPEGGPGGPIGWQHPVVRLMLSAVTAPELASPSGRP
jgi:hypothetical protein